MPKKAKIKDKNVGNPIYGAVYKQVEKITHVPEDRFRSKKNKDTDSLLARNLALSLLRLSGLGLRQVIQPFAMKSTQTIYQAANRVREAVKADPEIGTKIRRICANLGIDTKSLLGVEHKKAVVSTMSAMFTAAAGASAAPERSHEGTDDAISFAGLNDWERGALAGNLYRMWKGRNPKSAARISDETKIPIAQVNAWLVEADELARVNPELFNLLNEE